MNNYLECFNFILQNFQNNFNFNYDSFHDFYKKNISEIQENDNLKYILPIDVINRELDNNKVEYFTKCNNKLIKLGFVISYDFLHNENNLCIILLNFTNNYFVYTTLINEFDILYK